LPADPEHPPEVSTYDQVYGRVVKPIRPDIWKVLVGLTLSIWMAGPGFVFPGASATSFSMGSWIAHVNADFGGVAPLILMNQHRLPSTSRHDQYTAGCALPGASWQRIAASAALPAVIAAKMIAADMTLMAVIHVPRWPGPWISGYRKKREQEAASHFSRYRRWFSDNYLPARETELLHGDLSRRGKSRYYTAIFHLMLPGTWCTRHGHPSHCACA
jgi:hypothetical protein